jgi:uncharacterized phage protein (TIGR01671 family)
MRKLKFRAWDSIRKKMYYPAGEIFTYETETLYPQIGQNFDVPDQGFSSTNGFLDENPIIQQYTEFNDKNDKEIFDGDILKLTFSRSDPFTGVNELTDKVYWNGDGWRFRGESLYEFAAHCEVIGNIFESKVI